MITGPQIRAARGLLRWSLEQLASETGLSRNALQKIEAANGIPPGRAVTIATIEATIKRAGIVIIEADAEGGSGVRFQK
ncbi:helix-turn-helix domain-containing protein [Paracoccus ravus]|uniref:helix-turn-helix domain-containing protein n=1 Tax=Paracoccus ravus TaxID=2447760 RepID=UPI00142F4632|nr:helix-turn-helix domain-containing protein [Paracoccus ravus]